MGERTGRRAREKSCLDSFFSEDEQESPGRSRKKAAALAGAAAGAALLLGSARYGLEGRQRVLTALCVLAGAGLLIYGLYFRQQSEKKFKNREEPADQAGKDSGRFPRNRKRK